MREYVKIFAELMEVKLKEHDEDRGETGWLNNHTTVKYLVNRMKEETEELLDAFNESNIKELCEECLDVANFCMMIRSRVWENNRDMIQEIRNERSLNETDKG